ncbi:hypothetical protein BdWA1_001215 [Babesia duncani]|uniref:Uncharacterized protein n=1 Tax=Babesia duncani TaxID=323732 RepID=A0AAD9UQM2_9APIC|nr:hypothetical protein BdWA1_001215 [Babesia duncani]
MINQSGLRGSLCIWRRFSSIIEEPITNNPIPFDFENIEKLVKSHSKPVDSPITLNKDDKKLFHLFLRETNAITYTAAVLKKPVDKLTCSSNNSNPTNNHQWLTKTIGNKLSQLSLNNRIIVLQRSLAAWQHSRNPCWYTLTTKTLRSCCINDEIPDSKQLVNIFAALSKWRFRNMKEFAKNFDIIILSASNWTMDQASQILWSLAHLKCFELLSFECMNSVVLECLENNPEILDDTIHRIINANLIKTSQVGNVSPVYESIANYLTVNPHYFKNLKAKTLLGISSFIPMLSSFNQDLIRSLISRATESLDDFTHIQAAHFVSNLALIKDKLDGTSGDLCLNLLYEFKESIYNSNVAFVPSLTAKLLYSFRIFLGAFDVNFVSKCLSDLNVNLHLLGSFSVLGNIQCLKLLSREKQTNWDSKFINSLESTSKKLINFQDGYLYKPLEDGGFEKLDNLRLWHYGMLTRLQETTFENISTLLMSYMDSQEQERVSIKYKDFSLFLLHTFNNIKIKMNRNMLNCILMVSTNLYNQICKNTKIHLPKYWNLFYHNLAYLGIFDAFERECSNMTRTIHNDTTRLLFLSIQTINGKTIYPQVFQCLNDLSVGFKSKQVSRTEMIAVRFALLTALLHHDIDLKDYGIDYDLKQQLLSCFYTGKSNGIVTTENEFLEYIQHCCSRRIRPVDVELTYTRLFFLQDHPQLFLENVPDILISGMITAIEENVNLTQVASVLQKEKSWSNLIDHLKSQNLQTELVQDCNLKLVMNTTCDLDEFKISKIQINHDIGPFTANMLMEDTTASKSIAIFVNASRDSNTMVRQAMLSQMGIEYIEMYRS